MNAIKERPGALASGLRVILKRHFADAVKLVKVLPGEQFCIIRHNDGTRGCVPTASVVMLGVGE